MASLQAEPYKFARPTGPGPTNTNKEQAEEEYADYTLYYPSTYQSVLKPYSLQLKFFSTDGSAVMAPDIQDTILSVRITDRHGGLNFNNASITEAYSNYKFKDQKLTVEEIDRITSFDYDWNQAVAESFQNGFGKDLIYSLIEMLRKDRKSDPPKFRLRQEEQSNIHRFRVNRRIATVREDGVWIPKKTTTEAVESSELTEPQVPGTQVPGQKRKHATITKPHPSKGIIRADCVYSKLDLHAEFNDIKAVKYSKLDFAEYSKYSKYHPNTYNPCMIFEIQSNQSKNPNDNEALSQVIGFALGLRARQKLTSKLFIYVVSNRRWLSGEIPPWSETFHTINMKYYYIFNAVDDTLNSEELLSFMANLERTLNALNL